MPESRLLRSRRTPARRGWIFEERDQRGTVEVIELGEAAEFDQRREQVDRAYRPGAELARFPDVRCDDDHGDARAHFPQRALVPGVLLAQVPAVVRPEHDDRVFGMWRTIQRIQHAPQLGVGGRTPSPRNDMPASIAITTGMSIEARISKGPITLGMTCTRNMRAVLAPMLWAAITNSDSFKDSVWVRMMRA